MSLKNLEEKLDDDIYLIPVLLDDIEKEHFERPIALQHLQMINGYLSDGKEQILDSIKTQFEKMKIELKHIQEETKVFWTVKPVEKIWDGYPGYKVSFDFIEFQSDRYKDIHYIADIINGQLANKLLETTACEVEQDLEYFPVEQMVECRTNSYTGRLYTIFLKNNIISIQYDFDHYGAGAMHGSQWTECHNFMLTPLVQISFVSRLLEDMDINFSNLQQIVRDKLVQYLECENDDEIMMDGTNNPEDLSNFALADRHIEFKFRNYQVCSYAQGNPSISIFYDEISHLLSKHAKEQLGLEEKLD